MTTQVQAQVQTQAFIPAIKPIEDTLAPFADPILRAVVGLTLVPHGAQKLFGAFGGFGLEGTGQWMASIGFEPGYLAALGVGLLEFVGGILLALGLFTRPVALAIAAFMAVAVTVHFGAGYFWINQGGGWAVPLIWGTAALFFAIRGGGNYSVDRAIGREF